MHITDITDSLWLATALWLNGNHQSEHVPKSIINLLTAEKVVMTKLFSKKCNVMETVQQIFYECPRCNSDLNYLRLPSRGVVILTMI